MQRIIIKQKATQVNGLLFAIFFVSPCAQAAFSEKWGYFSFGATLLFLLALWSLGGLQLLRKHLSPSKPSDFFYKLYRLTKEAELHHKEVATNGESIENWAGDHIYRRVAFLSKHIEPLVAQGLIKFEQAVKKEDFALITRYYDLIYASRGDTDKRQRADEVEIKRYLKQQSDSELRTFTLEKLIRTCFLNQKIGAAKADRLWAKICEQYNRSAAG